MTKKLYDNNVYLSECDAIVTQEKKIDGHWWYAFNQTIFYPEGGGQGADTGSINNITVIDVQKIDGEIMHCLEERLASHHCELALDMTRRLDHMQQHCAEHILSGLLFDEFGLTNVGFHMNAEVVTIDVDQRDFKGDDMILLESMANRVVRANLPIEVRYYNTLESDQDLGLRKKLTVNESVRIVSIPGVDNVACGGTHPKKTGDVGYIKILKSENNKKGSRLTFVAGLRASRWMSKEHLQWQKVAQTLSSDHLTFSDAFDQYASKSDANLQVIKNQNIMIATLMDQLKENEAFEIYDGEESMAIKELLAQKRFEGGTELIAIIDIESMRFSITHKEAIDPDALITFKKLLTEFGGKGGGNPKKFQGKFTEVEGLKSFADALKGQSLS